MANESCQINKEFVEGIEKLADAMQKSTLAIADSVTKSFTTVLSSHLIELNKKLDIFSEKLDLVANNQHDRRVLCATSQERMKTLEKRQEGHDEDMEDIKKLVYKGVGVGVVLAILGSYILKKLL